MREKLREELREYTAKLVRAQLYSEEVPAMPEGITVEQIVKIAQSNHMTYLLVGALLKAQVEEKYVPVLKQSVLQSVSKTVMQVNELQSLGKAFEEQGIVNQPMKGSVMKFYYPSPEMREMGDLDILIREEDMEKADKVLLGRGYHQSKEEDGEHHDTYFKAPFMCVEAHKSLYARDVDKMQYEYFKDISKRVLREGCQYTYDFSIDEFYVYMMAHMAKHFYVKGCGIRNLVDIHIYQERFGSQMNRAYVEQELVRCGILTFTKHMERLTKIWLEGEAVTPLYEDIFEYMVNGGTYGKDENGIWNKYAEEEIATENVSKWKLKLWYLFPSYNYMSKYYPWIEKKPFLLPWAWIVRAFKAVFVNKGSVRHDMVQDITAEQIAFHKNIYQKMELRFK